MTDGHATSVSQGQPKTGLLGFALWSLGWAAAAIFGAVQFVATSDWPVIAALREAVITGNLTKLDWSGWAQAAAIILGSVGVGAGAAKVSGLAIDKISLILTGASFTIETIKVGGTTYKGGKWDREAQEKLDQTLAGLPDNVARQVRAAFGEILQAATPRMVKLPLEDFEKAEMLVHERVMNTALKKENRDLEAHRDELILLVQEQQEQLAAERQARVAAQDKLVVKEFELATAERLLDGTKGVLDEVADVSKKIEKVRDDVAARRATAASA